jgi:hypothetical protein
MCCHSTACISQPSQTSLPKSRRHSTLNSTLWPGLDSKWHPCMTLGPLPTQRNASTSQHLFSIGRRPLRQTPCSSLTLISPLYGIIIYLLTLP